MRASGALYRLAWGLYLAMAVAGVVWLGLRHGRIGLELFVDPGRWWLDLALGLVAGAALLALWQTLRRVLSGARDLEERIAELLGPLEPSEALAMAALSGFAEELFFRGAMQDAWGWIPATLVFALLHTGPGAAYRTWTVFALAAGLLFAGLVVWRGNLLAPVAAHMLVNGVNLWRISRLSLAAPGGAARR